WGRKTLQPKYRSAPSAVPGGLGWCWNSMRSLSFLRAALVPSIRRAYLPSRTGDVTTITLSFLGGLFHCSVVPVSKSARQMTLAETVVIDRKRRAARNAARICRGQRVTGESMPVPRDHRLTQMDNRPEAPTAQQAQSSRAGDDVLVPARRPRR